VANASKAGNWYPGTEGPDYLDGRSAFHLVCSLRPVLRMALLLLTQLWTRRLLFAAVDGVLITSIRCRSLAGDFGFDPLRLGENPDALKWYAAPSKPCVRFGLACAFAHTT